MNALKEYLEELEEMLKKRSVKALDEFTNKHRLIFGEKYLIDYEVMTHDEKLDIICRLILSSGRTTANDIEWAINTQRAIAKRKLKKLGMIK